MVPSGIQVGGFQVKLHTNDLEEAGLTKMHTKHTNAPQKTWIIYKNTIDMENGTVREAGLHVKTR